MTGYRIPFNRPHVAGDELRHIASALERGHLSGDGEFGGRCAKLLEAILRVHQVLLTPSCTDALEMCALLLDVEEGDEVIVPSFAYVTTASAFVARGARPVFADVRADTLNLDETKVGELVTPRTKLIVVVHYAGVGCEMDELLQLSEQTGVALVEDNAHGLFGRYKGAYLGTFGCLATQSFHETKNFTCGEGGALLVNRPEMADRAVVVRNKGTDRARFLRGEVSKYSWIDQGSNYLLSELQAAFLYGQLAARDRIQAERQRIWQRYRDELGGWAHERGIDLPHVPEHCVHPSHMFYLLLPSREIREALVAHLDRRGILAVSHFEPLHASAMGRRLGGSGECPVAESVSGRILRLPLFNGMSPQQQTEVVAALHDFPGP